MGSPVGLIADVVSPDFALTQLIESGQVAPIIERTYPLSQAADAISYVEAGNARGKVVVPI